MDSGTTLAARAAARIHRGLERVDIRLLVALVSLGGVFAWTAPWRAALPVFCIAAVLAFTAANRLREGRGALAAYASFIALWTVSQFALHLWEQPGEEARALELSLLLGGRLFTLLGLALAVPLAATPLALARAFSWYCGWLARVEGVLRRAAGRGGEGTALAEGAWRAALALCLMMAFFPRALRTLKGLRRSLAVRAPHLKAHRRAALLGLALLRAVSAQTWDMALAVASRDLYRAGPWAWRDERRARGAADHPANFAGQA